MSCMHQLEVIATSGFMCCRLSLKWIRQWSRRTSRLLLSGSKTRRKRNRNKPKRLWWRNLPGLELVRLRSSNRSSSKSTYGLGSISQCCKLTNQWLYRTNQTTWPWSKKESEACATWLPRHKSPLLSITARLWPPLSSLRQHKKKSKWPGLSCIWTCGFRRFWCRKLELWASRSIRSMRSHRLNLPRPSSCPKILNPIKLVRSTNTASKFKWRTIHLKYWRVLVKRTDLSGYDAYSW